MNYADLGLQIRRLRKRKKMTQAQLARETGISAPYLGLIEQGRRIASLETFVRICNALQAEPGLLLSASLTRNENPLDLVSHLLAEAQKLLSPEEKY
ncbi:MAG: helix-turn-helix transcriptional regulator [Clostridia bacterium]|nr:helix-turn-helix transcriptional regulator [Clostridia bacterium]